MLCIGDHRRPFHAFLSDRNRVAVGNELAAPFAHAEIDRKRSSCVCLFLGGILVDGNAVAAVAERGTVIGAILNQRIGEAAPAEVFAGGLTQVVGHPGAADIHGDLLVNDHFLLRLGLNDGHNVGSKVALGGCFFKFLGDLQNSWVGPFRTVGAVDECLCRVVAQSSLYIIAEREVDMALIGGERRVAVVNQRLADVHQLIPCSGDTRDAAGIKDVLIVPYIHKLRKIREVEIFAVTLRLRQHIVCADNAVAIRLAVGLRINRRIILAKIHHAVLPQNHAGVGVRLKHRDLRSRVKRRAKRGLNVRALIGDLDLHTGVFLHEGFGCGRDDLTVVRGLRIGRPEHDVCVERIRRGLFRVVGFSLLFGGGSVCGFALLGRCGRFLDLLCTAAENAKAQKCSQQEANPFFHFSSS